MKKLSYLAAAALVLASCSEDQYVGNYVVTDADNGAISFGSLATNSTRAWEHGDAAAKLNNNFIVYGFKHSATEAANGTGDVKVFDTYNVEFTASTGNTTESNTSGWEYVGLNQHSTSGSTETTQSIKYWDYKANGYVFSAVSGKGESDSITATKVTTGTSVYDKGWAVEVPTSGITLDNLYASKRVPMAPPTGADKEVDLTFYALTAKIRFAMYEAIPGYSVKVDKMYSTAGDSETNFAVDGAFNTLSTTENTTLNITYYSATDESNNVGIENCPKMTYSKSSTATGMIFGEGNMGVTLGVTANDATYDNTDRAYNSILPVSAGAAPAPMKLKLDYTLTSTDGSGETITVYGATVTVPAIFNNWKPNFAYTYIFKISDNTNGHTNPEQGPAGLYPITFDAVVAAQEDGIQQTISTIANPTFTTYSKGEIASEYKTGSDIYFTISESDGVLKTNLAAMAKVYKVTVEADKTFNETYTEEVIANHENNPLELTAVTTNATITAIPLKEGSAEKNLVVAAGSAAKFTPATAGIYTIQYNIGTAEAPNYVYKVIVVTD